MREVYLDAIFSFSLPAARFEGPAASPDCIRAGEQSPLLHRHVLCP